MKRVGIGKVHTVEGKNSEKIWASGKVKRVDYEYMFTRTFYGSTQPANPKEFYKPIKKKSFYYIPVEDITIKYVRNGQVFQTLSMDSLILRSYLEDGSPRDIYYLNADLQADSIYRFYENGKLKTKIIGGSDQLKENLVLSLSHRPEMVFRQQTIEWTPDGRSMMMYPYYRDNPHAKGPSYPEKQYYCHGNGKPYVVITWHLDSVADKYRSAYAYFDPQGNVLDSNHISSYGTWTGMKYEYYDNGALKKVSEMCADRFCGKTEHWNMDSTINYIEYRSKFERDSVVYYKQLKDTLLTWKPTMNFKWNQQDSLAELIHKHCKFGFKNDGSVHYCRFDGEVWESYEKYWDERMQLEHFGSKDELGFPHGPWFGVNALKDTVYEINFHHGWLHGPYRVNNSYWENNWTRTYNMGLEIDSSVRMYKGHIREILYFSEPGKLAKKAVFSNEGHLWYVDTTFNGKEFYRLRGLNKSGWESEVGRIDTALNQFYTKRFFYAPDSLSYEEWRGFNGNRLEWKEYYRETGALKIHWKDEGLLTKIEENPKPGKTPKKRVVQLAFRWTYDEAGNLIKKERLENGVVVD